MSEKQESKIEKNADAVTISQQSKNGAVFVWFGALLLGFFPSIITYIVEKDDQYVKEQAKESLNWMITYILILIALPITIIGFLALPFVPICHLVFCIMAIMKTKKGDSFKVPFAFRFLK